VSRVRVHGEARRRIARAVTEMHYRLRTEGDTPARKAVAVWLGTVIGCLPLYGAHFVLCVVLARVFRVSRLITYLAAHVNNPLTAPVLLYLGYGVGGYLLEGRWPGMAWGHLASLTWWSLGRDLLVGSLAIGLVLATALAGGAYTVGRLWQRSSPKDRLWEATSRRYLSSGILPWEFVLAKLRRDPLYPALLSSGVLPRAGTLLDLGCGRGIVLTLIETAASLHASGDWEKEWPAPPLEGLVLRGVERSESLSGVARSATAGRARIEVADLVGYHPEPCDGILLFDVLHYLDGAAQVVLIERACRALEPNGVMILREADAGLGLRFLLTRTAERLSALIRLHWRQRFTYRSAAEWCSVLAAQGLETRTQPSWRGTPFGNVLIVARARSESVRAADG
jgi:uncharacterized protein (DUF2062 family)